MSYQKRRQYLAVFLTLALLAGSFPAVALGEEEPVGTEEPVVNEEMAQAEAPAEENNAPAVLMRNNGETVKVNNLKDLKEALGSEKDLTIDVSGLESNDGPTVVKEKFTLKANITLTSGLPSFAFNASQNEWNKFVVLEGIGLTVPKGKVLTLQGCLSLHGPVASPVVDGSGQVVIDNGAAVYAVAGQDAIALSGPGSAITVDMQNISKYEKENDVIQPHYGVYGGDGSGDQVAGVALKADRVDVISNDANGFHIRGGNHDTSVGAFAIDGGTVNIDLSASGRVYWGGIKGGNAPYPGGAVIGTELNIKSGDGGIAPGESKKEDLYEVSQDNPTYHGVVEVRNGGHLTFGEGITDQNQSQLIGFQRTNAFGPTILAHGNAGISILGGSIWGRGVNYYSTDETWNAAQWPVIQSDSGTVEVRSVGVPTSVYGGNHLWNTAEAIIKSNSGDVVLSGKDVEVKGPQFTIKSYPADGYAKNPAAPKTGAAGIMTGGSVTVQDGARIIGGTIDNINGLSEEKLATYRTGSGIVGAKKVQVLNGAVVQGCGAFEYYPDKLKDSYRSSRYNLSTGHGLENVGSVEVNGGQVHGGDVFSVPGRCGPDCIGTGTAGSGIVGAQQVTLTGHALVTGGSGTGMARAVRGPAILMPQNVICGHGVQDIDRLTVKDQAQLYGGNSGMVPGHGVYQVREAVVADAANIEGGALRGNFLSKHKRAGSGIEAGEKVTITGGTVKAGQLPWQYYIEGYKKQIHPTMLNNEIGKGKTYSGYSQESVAVSADRQVIVDGSGQTMPKLSSFVAGAPIVRLADEANLLVGRGELEAANDQSPLVHGGHYHVDIFKENKINTVEELEDGGLHYRSQDAIGLYRILERTDQGYKDQEQKGLKTIDVFPGYKLYAENTPLTLKQEGVVRKNNLQTESLALDRKQDLKAMPNDNIFVKPPISEKPKGGGGKVYDLIKDLHHAYLIGYPDNTFHPEDNMTRAEVTAMFARLLAKKPGNENLPTRLTDIQSDDWYYRAVAYMEDKGLVAGYPDGSFRPNRPISRAEFAALASRFEQLTEADDIDFTDLRRDHWAYPVIASAARKGWVSGYPDNSFQPEKAITRAEVTAVTNRMLNRHADVAFIDRHGDDLLLLSDVHPGYWAYGDIHEAVNGHDFKRLANGLKEEWLRLNGERFTI